MTALAHQNTAWQHVLTPRQAEVLELIAAGYTNHEIAQEHWVTEHSVKSLITEIYLRLGLHIDDGMLRNPVLLAAVSMSGPAVHASKPLAGGGRTSKGQPNEPDRLGYR
jgi:DNA-binding CsgD family transcriptional regulator